MKIGEFAKRYDMKPSAVRYYVDKALLTPRRNNGQYFFDERCREQMEKILQYKQLQFSLEDIELLFYYESLSGLKDPEVNSRITEMLLNKKTQLIAEALTLRQTIDALDLKIAEMEQIRRELDMEPASLSHAKAGRTRVPLAALEMLVCPVCGSRCSISGAEINPEGIREGTLRCSCGHELEIRDGILLCDGASDGSPFKAFENIDSVLATTEDFSPAYRTLTEKGHLWIFQQIVSCEEPLRTLLAGPFSFNFLLKHLGSLPEEMLFIIVDPSIQKIRKLQDYFSDTSRRILFIAGDIRSIPLKKEVIDLYIDDFSGNNYTFTYNENLFPYIGPLLRPRGLLVGCFVNYTAAPKSLRNFRQDHPSFRPELMSLQRTRRNFEEAGLSLREEKDHGSPEGKQQDFIRQVDGEKVSLITYRAVK